VAAKMERETPGQTKKEFVMASPVEKKTHIVNTSQLRERSSFGLFGYFW